MVEITKDYRFNGPQGEVGLLDLFEGRQQLIVGHFMFDPAWEDGCPSCSAGVDEVVARAAGAPAHPRHHARLRLARAAGEARALEGEEGLGRPVVLVRRAATSTTTSTSPSTTRGGRRSTTTARSPTACRRWPERAAVRDAGHELLPARRRPRLPHLLVVRARRGADRRLVLLPRPHRARAPGGVGGAEGARRRARARRSPTSRASWPIPDRRRERLRRLDRREVADAVERREVDVGEERVEPVGPGAREERVVLLPQDGRGRRDPLVGAGPSRPARGPRRPTRRGTRRSRR